MPFDTSTDNLVILDAIKTDASMDYRTRIPDATRGNIQGTLQALHRNRPLMNEFLDALVNRIGSMIARDITWNNPLSEFKRGMLEFGDTIEEIQIGLLKAKVYDPDRNYLEDAIFGQEKPDVQANFHRVNRQNFYKITVNEALLTRAFLESAGLSSFITQLLGAPTTSDQWDEFLATVNLFAEYEANGGFYHVHVDDVADLESDANAARGALRKMRAMADTMTFLSTKYNTAGMPTFANRDELCLFVTPEYNAAIDVEALAGAFNVDRANMHGRVIPLPKEHLGIDGVQAIMTTRDFFVIADQRIENTSQINPAGLYNNYFFHHWQVISASRFVPAVMFHTGADDQVIEIAATTPTSVGTLTITDAYDNTVANNGDATRGVLYQIAAPVVPADADQAVKFAVTGNNSPNTRISSTGVLYIGGDEDAAKVTVTATTAYLDPADVREDSVSKTIAVTPAGASFPEWPVAGVVVGFELLDQRIDVVDGTTAYTVASNGANTVSPNDVDVISDGPISSTVTVDKKVVTVKTDSGRPGGKTTYTLTLTP